ncbi:MAG: NosD domain-containing protein [Bacteroidota bacterium]
MKTILSIASILLIPLLLPAATYTVTNTDDSGAGSFRQAIIDANSVPGPDNINFNIPTSDPNYNATTGVWTITPSTDLPMITGGYTNINATTQTTNQGNTNTQGPEIALDGGNTLTYGFRIVSPSNTIKGFIIGQFEFGIQIYGTMATGNSITTNYIGADRSGAGIYSNDHGIGFSGDAANITIANNLISGNTIVGIVCSPANNIFITGNKIGTDISGMLSLPNPIGIILDNSYNNTIGGISPSERNIISGNTDCGILINDIGSSGNTIIGNYIGINENSTDTVPNGNGVMVISANNNTIGGTTSNERNIISGNMGSGIVMNGTGANNNSVIGNYIGIDSSGTIALSNHYGVIIKADADNNIVGGSTSEERNVISANLEIGVYIEASDSNTVSGNYIGTDFTGTTTFTYPGGDTLIQANGVEINTVSKYNIIGGMSAGERNIISGNRVYGAIYYGQVSQNSITGNYIGTDVTGSYAIPNATGICVDDASNHNIMADNLLSGNISYGLFIVTTGSNYNVFKGNLVGTNAAGTDTIPNDVGLLLGGGAKYNLIGGATSADRNVFSGNRYGGIEIADNGTDHNELRGNYIGTDITGNVALPNAFGIAVSSLTTASVIDGNVISGNNTFGIVLTDATDSNLVVNNLIGIGSDCSTDLGNGVCGILIGQGAINNFIGAVGQGNSITYNDSAGIVIIDNITVNNTISANSIYDNDFLGIDIFPPGINSNDAGDNDNGPNNMMNFPVIDTTGYDTTSGVTIIIGTLDTQDPGNATVEVFKSAPDLLFNHGEGKTYLGSTTPDNSGNWTIAVTGLIPGDKVTATARDVNGNTSEFSLNTTTVVGSMGIKENSLFNSFSFTVYPNPASGSFTVNYEIYDQSLIEISILDITGKKVKKLFQGKQPAGKHSFIINSLSISPETCFLVLKTDNKLISIKQVNIMR